MPHYHRDPETGEMVQVADSLDQVQPIEEVQPSVSITGSRKRYFCTVCKPEKAFLKAGVLSIHFNRVHANLRKDKDSWRSYMRVEVMKDGSNSQ